MSDRDEPGAHNGHGPRAKYLTGKPAANDVGGLVVATRAELEELIEIALGRVLDARDARQDAAGSELLDRKGIAKALGCGLTLVDQLRRRGMPCERLGESPRFDLAACRDWVRKQETK